MSEDANEENWSVTTFEGSRREQLRRVQAMTVRQRLEIMDELHCLSERLQSMPRLSGGEGTGRRMDFGKGENS